MIWILWNASDGVFAAVFGRRHDDEKRIIMGK